jgi:adenomatosis polyposis coli protein
MPKILFPVLLQEVLKHLQGKLEQEACVLVSSGQTEVLEQLKGEGPAGTTPEGAGRGRGSQSVDLHPLTYPALQMDISSLYNLKFQPPALGPEPAARTPQESPVHGSGPSKDSFGELSRATIRLLEELDRER